MGRMYKPKTYKRKKKRTYTRKKESIYQMSSVNKSNPFPKRFKTKLRYEQQINMNAGLGAVATHIFRASSLYDPDWSGTGHQPRYFDEIMPLYDHFTVNFSKITVMAVNTGNPAYIVGVRVSDQATAVSKINDLIENRDSTWKIVGHQYTDRSIANISKTFSYKRDIGISVPMAAAENCRGTIAQNPNENGYFLVTVGAYDTAIDLGDVPLRIMIDYTVTFTEPKITTQS